MSCKKKDWIGEEDSVAVPAFTSVVKASSSIQNATTAQIDTNNLAVKQDIHTQKLVESINNSIKQQTNVVNINTLQAKPSVSNDFYTKLKTKVSNVNLSDNNKLELLLCDIDSYIENINVLQKDILRGKTNTNENTVKSISEVISSSNKIINDREQQGFKESNLDLSKYEHKDFSNNELPPILKDYAKKTEQLKTESNVVTTNAHFNESKLQQVEYIDTQLAIDTQANDNLEVLGVPDNEIVSKEALDTTQIVNIESNLASTDEIIDNDDNLDSAVYDDEYIASIDYNIETDSFNFSADNSDLDHETVITKTANNISDQTMSKIIDGNPNQAHKTQNMLTNSTKSSYNLSRYTDDDFFDSIEQECSFYRLLKQANFLPHSHDFSALIKSELKLDDKDTSKATLIIQSGFEFLVNDPNWVSDIEKKLSIAMHQALKLSIVVVDKLPDNSPRAYAHRAYLQEIEKQRQTLFKVKGLTKIFDIFKEDLQTATIELLK